MRLFASGYSYKDLSEFQKKNKNDGLINSIRPNIKKFKQDKKQFLS